MSGLATPQGTGRPYRPKKDGGPGAVPCSLFLQIPIYLRRRMGSQSEGLRDAISLPSLINFPPSNNGSWTRRSGQSHLLRRAMHLLLRSLQRNPRPRHDDLLLVLTLEKVLLPPSELITNYPTHVILALRSRILTTGSLYHQHPLLLTLPTGDRLPVFVAANLHHRQYPRSVVSTTSTLTPKLHPPRQIPIRSIHRQST